jgi:teichuronic acid biosynthesis protein TuaE
MGVGVGNAEQHMAKYGEDLGGIVNLHNWWLEVLVNYGLIIFLAYLHFYLSLVKDLLKVIRNSGILRLKMMAEVLTVSLASFSIACIGPSSLLPQRYMWFLFALVLAVLNYAKEDISLREEGGRKN